MKYTFFILYALGLVGCGSSNSPAPITQTVITSPTTLQHDLTVCYNDPHGNCTSTATINITQTETVYIPDSVAILADPSFNGNAELMLGNSTYCNYQSNGLGLLVRVPASCYPTVNPAPVQLNLGDTITLQLRGGSTDYVCTEVSVNAELQ